MVGTIYATKEKTPPASPLSPKFQYLVSEFQSTPWRTFVAEDKSRGTADNFYSCKLGIFPDSHSENLKVYCHKANKEMKQTCSLLTPGCCTGIAQGANCGQICQHIQCFMCTHLPSCRRKVHLPLLLQVYQLCVR
jgi:hypothetical protein